MQERKTCTLKSFHFKEIFDETILIVPNSIVLKNINKSKQRLASLFLFSSLPTAWLTWQREWNLLKIAGH